MSIKFLMVVASSALLGTVMAIYGQQKPAQTGELPAAQVKVTPAKTTGGTPDGAPRTTTRQKAARHKTRPTKRTSASR